MVEKNMQRYNGTTYFAPGIMEMNGDYAIACQSIIDEDDIIFWSGIEWDQPLLAKIYKTEKEALELAQRAGYDTHREAVERMAALINSKL